MRKYQLASLYDEQGHEKDKTVFSLGNLRIGQDFVVIAGPCSVESPEQILEAAQAAKAAGADILRGGAFKPRTSPYSFQGLGVPGLQYLRRAADAVALPVITEVLDPRDVELVSEYADILQIGARNMQNFPLLSQVGASGKPVLLKRGMNATLEEWLCSAEYILQAGNHRVILCERGIRTFETYTHNTLDMSSVPSLKELTHLPVIVDPSHATGRRSLVPAMALSAIAAGCDGLMLEVHPQPEKALSDEKQQLDPHTFQVLMRDIKKAVAFRRELELK